MRVPTLILILALTGCRTDGLDPDIPTYQWELVRLELDPALLGNAGTLPVFSRPTGTGFGMVPRADGFLQTTDGGKVLVNVTIREPVMSYRGNTELLDYPIVRFFGKRSEDGLRIFAPDEEARSAALGAPTVLHVQHAGSGQLRVQGATRDRMLPYIYVFEPSDGRMELVYVPFRP